jgi:type I restriction enzyme S subunit
MSGMYPRYVSYFLQSPDYWHEVNKSAAGIALQNVNAKKLAAISVPVAPFQEQRKIVGEIEKQFTRLDAAVEALKRVKANLKRYRASVLKAACEGRLVPTEAELARREGRPYEPASELLKRILAERRSHWEADQLAKFRAAGKEPNDEKWKAKYKEPPALDTTALPPLPEGWNWATVEEVSSIVQYGSSAKTIIEDSQGVPVLRMGNILSDGRLDLSVLKYLPTTHHEFPDLLLRSGDILFNRTNSAELVGKSAVYFGTPDPCSFASYLIRVRAITGSNPVYMTACLNSSLGREWIKSVVSQQVGQANVNGTKLQAFVFPLAPSKEQDRIVAEIERRFSVIDELELQLDANLKRAERLRQAILKCAFEGKLVPQDPDDEPASALLDRIRAERAGPGNIRNGQSLPHHHAREPVTDSRAD